MPLRRRSGGISPIYADIRRRKEKRSKEERSEAAKTGLALKGALNLDIKSELVRQTDAIEELASKYKVQHSKIRGLLLHYRRQKKYSVNPWNAVLHEVRKEINDRECISLQYLTPI